MRYFEVTVRETIIRKYKVAARSEYEAAQDPESGELLDESSSFETDDSVVELYDEEPCGECGRWVDILINGLCADCAKEQDADPSIYMEEYTA